MRESDSIRFFSCGFSHLRTACFRRDVGSAPLLLHTGEREVGPVYIIQYRFFRSPISQALAVFLSFFLSCHLCFTYLHGRRGNRVFASPLPTIQLKKPALKWSMSSELFFHCVYLVDVPRPAPQPNFIGHMSRTMPSARLRGVDVGRFLKAQISSTSNASSPYAKSHQCNNIHIHIHIHPYTGKISNAKKESLTAPCPCDPKKRGERGKREARGESPEQSNHLNKPLLLGLLLPSLRLTLPSSTVLGSAGRLWLACCTMCWFMLPYGV